MTASIPGSSGLPLLGETLAFARNPFGFIDERLARHGRIFRSRILGRNAVIIAGPEATGRFIDSAVVARHDSMPPHVQQLFAGKSLPLLDGDEHRERKRVVNQAFTRAAIADYLPKMQASIETAFARWAGGGEMRWLDEMKRLSIEVICLTIMGLQPGSQMDALRRDYEIVLNGFATLPVNIPGTRYNKALKARDRIMDFFRQTVRERRGAPSGDGLSRILAAGPNLGDEDAALELHHIVIAGFIVFGELGGMVKQLTDHPEVRARLAAEIREKSPDGPITLETLMSMPYLLQVTNEVKRITPIIPGVFGIAKDGFAVDGKPVPAGWMILWTIRPTHTRFGVYDDAETFDPDRFSPERAEDRRHEHAFVPQGAGPVTGHRCPGLDFATYFMEVFAIVLLRRYAWELPPQEFALDYSKVPPEMKEGLRATVRTG
jgi:retinoid hydroxylase